MVFLGILHDGRNFCLGIPNDKCTKAINLLKNIMDRKKATVKDLQLLCGYLNFLCKAIYPGHAFIRRMYAKFSKQIDFNFAGHKYDKESYKLKQYHHAQLDRKFKEDCGVWLQFLDGQFEQAVYRLMTDFVGDPIHSVSDISYYLDVSAAKNLGFGAILGTSWIQAFWPENFIELNEPSIEFLELYGLLAGILT